MAKIHVAPAMAAANDLCRAWVRLNEYFKSTAHDYETFKALDAEVKRCEEDLRAAIRGVVRRNVEPVARDLLSIAETAMPDTYFADDSRCQRARSWFDV